MRNISMKKSNDGKIKSHITNSRNKEYGKFSAFTDPLNVIAALYPPVLKGTYSPVNCLSGRGGTDIQGNLLLSLSYNQSKCLKRCATDSDVCCDK